MSDDAPAPTHSHRFFRAQQEVYDGARAYFIEVFGQPAKGIDEPFPAYADDRTRKDAQGRAYVALLNRECAWPEVAEIITDLLAADQLEEVEEAEWISAASL